MIQDVIGNPNLLEQYGPIGIVCVIILSLYLKQSKRMQELEDSNNQQYKDEILRADKRHEDELSAYKDLIKEYVQLVENNTTVIGKLTICIESFKNTLADVKDKLKS